MHTLCICMHTKKQFGHMLFVLLRKDGKKLEKTPNKWNEEVGADVMAQVSLSPGMIKGKQLMARNHPGGGPGSHNHKPPSQPEGNIRFWCHKARSNPSSTLPLGVTTSQEVTDSVGTLSWPGSIQMHTFSFTAMPEP